MSSHPPSFLIQPSRPTTATSSSDTSTTTSHRFLPSTAPQQQLPSPLPPPHQQHGPIPNLLPIFTKSAPVPGTVSIRVEHTTFLCHREVLALGSPFFEALLTGDWKEMTRRENKGREKETELEVLREEVEEEQQEEDGPASRRDSYRTAGTSTSITSIDQEEDDYQLDAAPLATPRLGDDRPPTPTKLGADDEQAASEAGDVAPSMTASYLSSVVDDNYEDSDGDSDEGNDDTIICRLRLKEEQASTFQDFLSHLYPRLELLVTWVNAAELLRLSSKFDVPSLRNACIAFLLPSCAGNPIKGMKIAEDNEIPELFKEASRFALDNYGNWPAEELAILSEPTLLKLERRRSWFLERLLKLGLIQISGDYTCVPTCPDSTLCAKLVDEKWKSAWSSAFRFGTPQPSITYRSLRSLEPSLSSPALHLPMTACQDNARLFIADLFDRMFSLSVTPARGWGALTLNGTMSGSGGYGRTFGPSAESSLGKSSARYFLFIEMHDQQAKKERQERNLGGGGLMASSV